MSNSILALWRKVQTEHYQKGAEAADTKSHLGDRKYWCSYRLKFNCQSDLVVHALIPALRKLKQEDCYKFESSLGYVMSSGQLVLNKQ